MPVWSDTLLPATQHDVEPNEPKQLEKSTPPTVSPAMANGHETTSGRSQDDPIDLVDQPEAMLSDDVEEHSTTSLKQKDTLNNEGIISIILFIFYRFR